VIGKTMRRSIKPWPISRIGWVDAKKMIDAGTHKLFSHELVTIGDGDCMGYVGSGGFAEYFLTARSLELLKEAMKKAHPCES